MGPRGGTRVRQGGSGEDAGGEAGEEHVAGGVGDRPVNRAGLEGVEEGFVGGDAAGPEDRQLAGTDRYGDGETDLSGSQ